MQPLARLRFATDTFALGMPVNLELEIRYDPSLEILLNIKSEDFAPMELIRTQPVQGLEEGEPKTLRVIYHLRTFELLGEVQIRLPYRFVRGRDTLDRIALSNTAKMVERIEGDPEQYDFKLHEGLLSIEEPQSDFNFPYWALAIPLVLLGIAWILRRPIRSYLKMRHVRQEWEYMRRLWKNIRDPDADQLDQLNSAWRKYLDPHESLRLRAKTTPELLPALEQLSFLSQTHHKILLRMAKTCDQMIYAEVPVTEREWPLLREQMLTVLEAVYQHRKSELGRRY